MAADPAKQEIDNRTSPTGVIVYAAVKREGQDELDRTTSSLAWSGLAAGLSMGFSFVAEALLRASLPATDWRPLVAKFGYTVGFLIVVLGRQQLFTENTLTVILPLLRRRDSLTLKHVLRLWAIVLGANLVGAWLFATVAARTTMFDPDVRGVFDAIAQEAMAPGAATVMLRGIFAGWLIALMVWLLPFAESARVGVIIVITYVVGIGSFSHVIAGSVETFYLVASGAQSFGQYAFGYLLPSLVGNVIGGTSLVAAIAHAQYVGGAEAIDV
jgi:formate/nitrite transporter FocA (FNT family)